MRNERLIQADLDVECDSRVPVARVVGARRNKPGEGTYVCAWCKRVYSDEGKWKTFDEIWTTLRGDRSSIEYTGCSECVGYVQHLISEG